MEFNQKLLSRSYNEFELGFVIATDMPLTSKERLVVPLIFPALSFATIIIL